MPQRKGNLKSCPPKMLCQILIRPNGPLIVSAALRKAPTGADSSGTARPRPSGTAQEAASSTTITIIMTIKAVHLSGKQFSRSHPAFVRREAQTMLCSPPWRVDRSVKSSTPASGECAAPFNSRFNSRFSVRFSVRFAVPQSRNTDARAAASAVVAAANKPASWQPGVRRAAVWRTRIR